MRHRTEVHWLSQGPVIREDEQGLLTIFGGDGMVADATRWYAVRRTRCASCDRPGRVVMVGMVGMILKTSRVPRRRVRGTRGLLDFYPTIPTITTPIKFYSVTDEHRRQ